MSNFLKYKRQKSEKHLKIDSHLQYLHGECQTSGREQEKTSNKTRIHPDYFFFFNQQSQTNQKNTNKRTVQKHYNGGTHHKPGAYTVIEITSVRTMLMENQLQSETPNFLQKALNKVKGRLKSLLNLIVGDWTTGFQSVQ